MNAATLMNSGTGTKKPAMKLRRNQRMEHSSRPQEPDRDRRRERDPVPGERVERVVSQIPDEVLHGRVADDGGGRDADQKQRRRTAQAGLQQPGRFAGGRAENGWNGQQKDEPRAVGASQAEEQRDGE